MAKSLMIQATASGAGKSLLVTALCRIFKKKGIKVAPFKAQNMALNSYITEDGGEIGRAQALQAEAAGIEPTVDMNPVLLKASGEKGCQVIVHGRVYGNYGAKEYYSLRKKLWPAVKESFKRLASKYEVIIIEGAGSPAEINLLKDEIVNMRVARYAGAPVLLLSDIDRGGVFASLYGTLKLLGRDGKYIKAFVINKFRGDMEILRPGLSFIEKKTRRPVIGVIPYIKDIKLPEEDSLYFADNQWLHFKGHKDQPAVKIVVVALNYISNFTDFDPFIYEPDVELLYSRNPADIENADMVIVPGTKNTVKDLIFLKERKLDESIRRAFKKGIEIVGICGGYQILGKRISDPLGVESEVREIEGIGLLDIETVFEKSKITARVSAEINKPAFSLQPSAFLKGYEIHKGNSTGDTGLFKIKRLSSESTIYDGSIRDNCWGTYIHGIFENDHFRRAVINTLRRKKGLEPLAFTYSYRDLKDHLIESLSEIVERNLDMTFIMRLIS